MRLAEATGLVVSAANDANLGVRAEQLFGSARGHDHVVYVNGGASGIGGGLVVGGRSSPAGAATRGDRAHHGRPRWGALPLRRTGLPRDRRVAAAAARRGRGSPSPVAGPASTWHGCSTTRRRPSRPRWRPSCRTWPWPCAASCRRSTPGSSSSGASSPRCTTTPATVSSPSWRRRPCPRSTRASRSSAPASAPPSCCAARPSWPSPPCSPTRPPGPRGSAAEPAPSAAPGAHGGHDGDQEQGEDQPHPARPQPEAVLGRRLASQSATDAPTGRVRT